MNPLLLLALAATPSPVVVGSKAFTESVLLGEMARQVLAEQGIAAEHRRELGGTRVLWEALVRGDVDLYPEYTGTISQEIFGGQVPLSGLQQALSERGVVLGVSLGFDDTYALGVRRDVAHRLGLRTLSDLRAHPELRLGFSNEFLRRGDGWPALQHSYRLPQRDVRGLDHELSYRGLRAGSLDVVDLYSTDPEIQAEGLVVLEDDQHHFPEYRAVLLWRSDLEQHHPGTTTALRLLEGRVGVEAMRMLNAQARIERVPETAVAARFLHQDLDIVRGAAGLGEGEPGLGGRLLRRLGEHLQLVGAALALSILAALPLGILAARRPRLGRVILAGVGVLQTIPSLALLVLMIPLLGIGTLPAVAALFLYGLLPIVQNTHTGLTGIAPDLRESAEALGLPRWPRLWRVDLPLASPSILAGMKTSAVIAVGTATLGALVGAGGFGQPILTGIRLADTRLLLEGALPAAALALAVQALLDRAERLVVPRGLRLGGEPR